MQAEHVDITFKMFNSRTGPIPLSLGPNIYRIFVIRKEFTRIKISRMIRESEEL